MSPPIMTIPDDIFPSERVARNKDGMAEGLKVVGHWDFVLTDEHGNVKQKVEKHNLITTVGFQLISDALFIQSGRPAVASYLGVGTGGTAAAIGDTTLQTESLRKLAAYSYAAKVATLTATFNPGEATGALVEAGMLNAASVGLLLNRVVYPVINKGALDTLTSTFTFTLS